MKTLKSAIACLLLLSVISCTKTSNNLSSSTASNVSNSSNETSSFTIGQSYHGGIIFYIDNTGQHGLIASNADLLAGGNTQIAWKVGPNVVTGASGTAIGTGASNTAAIIAAIGSTGKYAALLCSKYKVGIYQDWYLPSKAELNLLYNQRSVFGNLDATNYWSSTEASKGKAWDQEFGGGFQFKDNKTFTLRVRAISSF